MQTNGNSNGILPMLQVFNNTARYVDGGGHKVNIFIYFIKCCYHYFVIIV